LLIWQPIVRREEKKRRNDFFTHDEAVETIAYSVGEELSFSIGRLGILCAPLVGARVAGEAPLGGPRTDANPRRSVARAPINVRDRDDRSNDGGAISAASPFRSPR
jgi:hypothetical protein